MQDAAFAEGKEQDRGRIGGCCAADAEPEVGVTVSAGLAGDVAVDVDDAIL